MPTSGFALAGIGRAGEGAEYVRAAIRLNPFNRLWDHSLGWCLAIDGQYEEAIDLLKKYADTDWQWTIAGLAAAYANLGEMDEARRLAIKSAEIRKLRLKQQGEPVPDGVISVIEEGHKKQYQAGSAIHEYLMDGLRKTGLT